MCPTEKAVHRMLKKVLQNHSDSEENIEEWVIHFLFGSNKLSYRTAEHSNSRVTLALSSCEMDVTPETQDIYNSELWNPVYTLTKTYSLYPKEHCAAASDVSYNKGRRQLPSLSPRAPFSLTLLAHIGTSSSCCCPSLQTPAAGGGALSSCPHGAAVENTAP